MPVYQGTYYTKTFTILDEVGNPIDMSDWELRTHLRDRKDDVEPLLELTTANGGWVTIDGPNGRVMLVITAEQSAELPVASIVMDVLRTDIVPGPVFIFAAKFSVKLPVTRDD